MFINWTGIFTSLGFLIVV